MKAGIFVEPGKMEVQEIDKPTIQKPTDAIIRIIRACVCGSDLWWYRGIANVTTYDKNLLLDEVLKGDINPGKVFTKRFDLDHIQEAYEAMDKREAIKSLIIVSDK